MPPPAPLEVKTIYTAQKGRRGPRPAFRRGPATGGVSLVLLGLLNLVAAGGLYYATWWRVDPFLYLTLMMKTPVDVDLEAAGTIFGVPPGGRTGRSERAASEPRLGEPALREPPWGKQTAQKVIPIAAYSWLTLATVAVIALSLASGAALGRGGGTVWRRLGVVLTIGTLLGLGFAVYRVWTVYGIQYRPDHLRIGMAGLAFLGLTVGLLIGRGVRGLTRLSAIVLILSALGSALGLYLGSGCGAIDPKQSTPAYLGFVFVIHSAWGWVLLAAAGRVRG